MYIQVRMCVSAGLLQPSSVVLLSGSLVPAVDVILINLNQYAYLMPFSS